MLNKPKQLSKNYIQRLTATQGQHYGIFQLVQFHSKKANFYSTHISDGFFQLKIIFLENAGKMITEKKIQFNEIIAAEVYNYNYEQGIYLVKEIKENWKYNQKIGKPKDWRTRKINVNKHGENLIKWKQQVIQSKKYQQQIRNESILQTNIKNLGTQQKIQINFKSSVVRFNQIFENDLNQQLHNQQKISLKTQNLQPACIIHVNHQNIVQVDKSIKSLTIDHINQHNQQIINKVQEQKIYIPEIQYSIEKQEKFGAKLQITNKFGQQQNKAQQKEAQLLWDDQLIMLLQQYQDIKNEKKQESGDDFAQLISFLDRSKHKLKLSQQNKEDEELSRLLNQQIQISHIQNSKPKTMELQQSIDENIEDQQILKLIQESSKDCKTKCKQIQIKYNDLPQLSQNYDDWIIKIKIQAKSALLQLKLFNSKNISHYFICILQDQKKNIIEATFLDPSTYQLILENHYYYLSKGIVKRPKFVKLRGINYILEFKNTVQIQEIKYFDQKPIHDFNFTPLSQIQRTQNDYYIDIIGIIKNFEDTIYTKDNVQKKKKVIWIVDPFSERELEIIDFSNNPNLFNIEKYSIVMIYNLKVNSYKDKKTLLASYNTILKKQYQENQSRKSYKQFCNCEFLDNFIPKCSFPKRNMDQLKNLESKLLQNHNLQINLSSEIEGRLQNFTKARMYYLACPTCRKKLSSDLTGKYKCLKCQAIKTPIPKFILSGLLINNLGSIYVLLQENIVKNILKVNAQQIWELEKANKKEQLRRYYHILDNLSKQWVRVQISGSLTYYNSKYTISYTIKYIEIIRQQNHCKNLLAKIKEYIPLFSSDIFSRQQI